MNKKMSFGRKLIAVPLTVLHYLFYGICLIVFWPVQWIALRVFGYKAHKKSVDLLNYCLNATLYLLASRVRIINKQSLPLDRPIIVVSNHQSHYDVTPLGRAFRKHHPKYVAKKELGQGIPGVSFNLKYGGSVLINRKDAKQSLTAIRDFAKYLEKNNYAGIIFPEGTRSKTGKLKRFSENGLKMLLKYAPSAVVVPVTINNSWKLVQYGQFPLDIGIDLSLEVHPVIDPKGRKFEDVFQEVQKQITTTIK
ncbi:1-acyl-sn-glycerol-3-phosphate acyltransferase [Flavobacteriaceae bacterium]|nr:1-acyl-sn-glycerol-3-phosphate acyltransferase [Flavobacteriaceae bacterium]